MHHDQASPCITMHHHALPRITMHYHAIPCITNHYQDSHGFNMIHQDSPGTKSCESDVFFNPCGCHIYTQGCGNLRITTKYYRIVFKFLENQHVSQMKKQSHYRLVLQFSWEAALSTENDYRLVLKLYWKSALLTNENTKSLQIGFSVFFGTQHQAPDKVYSLVYNFLGQN